MLLLLQSTRLLLIDAHVLQVNEEGGKQPCMRCMVSHAEMGKRSSLCTMLPSLR
jgi:hypothetical protein